MENFISRLAFAAENVCMIKIGLIFRLDVGMPTEVRERSQLKKNVKFYTFGPVDIIIIFTHPR